MRKVRLAYLVSHPIQYQAPLLRQIAQEPDIELTVFFGSDFSLRKYADRGFGVDVEWDVPLIGGYQHQFLPSIHDNGTVTPLTPLNYGIFSSLRGGGKDRRPFDVLWVHGYASVNALQGIAAAWVLGIPVLIRADSTLTDRPRGGMKLFAKRCFFGLLGEMISGVLATGTRNEAYWRYYLGEQMPMWHLPYAVDNDYFSRRAREAAQSRAALQSELCLEPGRPVILFASKLQERKCCSDLLEAYIRLAATRCFESPPYLLIVGDGEERKALERRVAQSGSKDVRFCGFRNQSELPRFFDLASVFVLPSRHEPWGLIVNEVMNAARPVILSDDVGCHPDLLTHGVEGFLFPVGDVAALAEALGGLLNTPGLAERMGQNALARIKLWDFEADVRGLRYALASVSHKIVS